MKVSICICALVLVGAALLTPSFTLLDTQKSMQKETPLNQEKAYQMTIRDDSSMFDYPEETFSSVEALSYDTFYSPTDETVSTMLQDQNDAGYSTDSGDSLIRGLPIYPNERMDGTPGRSFMGTLDPANRDDADWYRFTACEGQTIQISLSTPEDYGIEVTNTRGEPIATPYTVEVTGTHFMGITASEEAGTADYAFTLTVSGQNDADTNTDAGNTIDAAISLTPGTYSGYLDMDDPLDWYSFSANTGQGIVIDLEVPKRSSSFPSSDFDIYLYNPQNQLVHQGNYYGDDTIEYPADVSGTWKIKIDIFPGWDTTKWPSDYYLYGSGAYTLDLDIGGTAQSPPSIQQPEIVPVAQTFSIPNDPDSNRDEYTYLAAIPAANYLQDATRYVSPIIYTGDTTPTHWYGTVDDTTQYLLDDWETYLQRHNIQPSIHTLAVNPITSAATLATTQWSQSDTAVVVLDGSEFEDESGTVLDKEANLQVQTDVLTIQPSDLTELVSDEIYAKPMFIGPTWGSLTYYAQGIAPELGIITPRYEVGTESEWPHPYDGPGDSTHIYFPIAVPGMYFPFGNTLEGGYTLEITKYSGDRYKIPVTSTDSTLTVTATTSDPSYLEVFLVDPLGNIRRPTIPHWNGGPINPIHIWNGGHWEGIGFEDWRRWEPTYSREHTVELHHPMTGKWTAIVTPHYPYGEEQNSGTITYHITAELRNHNPDRIAAGLSAANGAVIASLKHVPLLYVTRDTVPSETTNALTTLGVKNVIFVEVDGIGSQVRSSLDSYTLTDFTTLQETVDYIKSDSRTENFITILSMATGDGYFAPAAMIAAYHGGPILNIGEIPDVYDTIDKATSFREYGGDWYHGCRAQAHLSQMTEAFDPVGFIQNALSGDIPEPGFDQHLRWYGDIHDGIKDFITGYGLDEEGKEAYMFVSPRDTDIRHLVMRSMSGNNSFAGQIPFDNIAMDTALICRDILYPALIYANPGRDATTTQLMNYPDGTRYSRWDLNDGSTATVLTSRDAKNSFSSHGRFYDPHVTWENWLDRITQGVSVNYYAGHGTGGSGVSAQFKNVAEQFPNAEHYVNNAHMDWWDSWRGYSGYDATEYTEDACNPRWGGTSWYNPVEPGLYDIIHFKHVDELLGNMHSEFELWQSCTTGQHFGPHIYLEHGSAVWYGNAGTGSCPPADWLDDQMLHDLLVNGDSLGEAYSKYVWLIYRDFTTRDPTTMYAWSSTYITHVQVIYGDPTLVLYNPQWIEPIPVTA